MLKKVLCFLTLSSVVLLGCSDDQTIAEYAGDIRIIDNFEILELDDPQYLFFNGDKNMFQKHNIITGEIEATFQLSDEQLLLRSGQLGDASYEVFLLVGENANQFRDSWDSTDLENLTVMVLILDEDLNVVSEFEVTETDTVRLASLVGRSRALEKEDELLIYYESFGNFFVYNLRTNETIMIFEIEEPFWVSDFQLTPFNQLVFIKFDMDDDEMETVYYGFIDLDTLKKEIFSTDRFDSPILDVFEAYLLLHENYPDDDAMPTEVLLLNLLTLESRIVLSTGYEIHDPVLISNGQLLFTSETTWYPEIEIRARLYDIKTSAVVFETLLVEPGALDEHEIIIGIEIIDIYLGVYVVTVGIAMECPLTFDIDWEALRFHSITLEIEDIDND